MAFPARSVRAVPQYGLHISMSIFRAEVILRIYVSDGTVHNIRRREMIWVGTGMAVLVVPLADQGDADKPLIERV
jgi:hypothetical protein